MLANLTVLETLTVVARLRLPLRATAAHQHMLTTLMNELGIAHCADSIVRVKPSVGSHSWQARANASSSAHRLRGEGCRWAG
jgi:hypothetical protein